METSSDTSIDEVFEVEKIEDKRILFGVVEYFIKWKNYSADENTWEPIGNLFCDEIIQEFEAKLNESGANVKPEPKKILNQRSTNEYLVKWSDDTESWTTNENGILTRLIRNFNATQARRKRLSTSKSDEANGNNNRKKRLLSFVQPTSSTDNEYDVDIVYIHNMKREKGEVRFLVEYEGSSKAWVPIDFVKAYHPQKVIAFYERCITWNE